MPREHLPSDVAKIRDEIEKALNTRDAENRIVGNCKHGIYAFIDYDGEPIYVGQTFEKLRVRIRRHLTNQRTDAVAMNVLDPFEVAEIEMWPFFELSTVSAAEAKRMLDAAEYTVYQQLLEQSTFKAVLNEKAITPQELISLPTSHRVRIIPDDIFEDRKHSDIRIARRADTIAALAKVISERDVKKGLRRTLLTQARRLQHLAEQRFTECANEPDDEEDES